MGWCSGGKLARHPDWTFCAPTAELSAWVVVVIGGAEAGASASWEIMAGEERDQFLGASVTFPVRVP